MAKKTTESDLVREICDWLHAEGLFFWRCNNVPVYGRSNDGQMRFRALPKYTPKGLPDLIVVRHGILLCFEVKSQHGIWKAEQRAFADKIQQNGAYYFLVRSLDEVKKVLM